MAPNGPSSRNLDAQGAITAAKRFLKENNVQQFVLDMVEPGPAPMTWRVRIRIGSIFGPQKDIIIDDSTSKIISFGNPRAP